MTSTIRPNFCLKLGTHPSTNPARLALTSKLFVSCHRSRLKFPKFAAVFSFESVQSLLSCLVAVVCLAEVNLSCFDQVLLLFSEEHQLHHLPSSDFYSRFSRDASYCEDRISTSNSPNANSFLYAMWTYVLTCISSFDTVTFQTF